MTIGIAVTINDGALLIVLGGEEQDARAEFNARAAQAVLQFGRMPGTGLMNNLVTALLTCAAETVRSVAARIPEEVGGTIRYAVIR